MIEQLSLYVEPPRGTRRQLDEALTRELSKRSGVEWEFRDGYIYTAGIDRTSPSRRKCMTRSDETRRLLEAKLTSKEKDKLNKLTITAANEKSTTSWLLNTVDNARIMVEAIGLDLLDIQEDTSLRPLSEIERDFLELVRNGYEVIKTDFLAPYDLGKIRLVKGNSHRTHYSEWIRPEILKMFVSAEKRFDYHLKQKLTVFKPTKPVAQIIALFNAA